MIDTTLILIVSTVVFVATLIVGGDQRASQRVQIPVRVEEERPEERIRVRTWER